MTKLTRHWNNLTGKYGFPSCRVPRWRLAMVSIAAFVAGVHVKIDGLPYGASYERHLKIKGSSESGEFQLPPV